jgi:hypothetical protein
MHMPWDRGWKHKQYCMNIPFWGEGVNGSMKQTFLDAAFLFFCIVRLIVNICLYILLGFLIFNFHIAQVICSAIAVAVVLVYQRSYGRLCVCLCGRRIVRWIVGARMSLSTRSKSKAISKAGV